MSVWQYADIARDTEVVWARCCPFCASDLTTIYEEREDTRRLFPGFRSTPWISNHRDGIKRVETCSACGWWKATDMGDQEGIRPQYDTRYVLGAAASLRELDLQDLTTPLQDVRDFLVVNYGARLRTHPRLFEECVASVFRSLGYCAVVTAYSGDGGIDAILEKDGKQIGVQVKRYKNSISVEQIRSLAGALVLHGMAEGIFVTTSSFQRGAAALAEAYDLRGHRIELVDAKRFYDALKLGQAQVRRIDAETARSLLSQVKLIQNVYSSPAVFWQ